MAAGINDAPNIANAAAPAIIAELGNDAAGKAARDFFTQLSETDATSFAGLIETLLTDPASGLGVNQRNQLRKIYWMFNLYSTRETN